MKIGVFGQGSIGRRHAQLLREAGQDVVTCDPSRPADANDDRTLWKRGVDAVVIATPPATHLALAQKAARYELPMLIEKPLALPEQIREVRAWREICKVPVLVGYQWRYAPELETLVKSSSPWGVGSYFGALKGRTARWLRQPQCGGGVFLEYSHALDYLLWAGGDEPIRRVLAVRGRRESVASVLWMTVSGGAGFSGGFRDPVEATLKTTNGSWSRSDSDLSACYRAQIAHFLACCEQPTLACDGIAQGLRVLELVEKARRSRGTWVI